MSEIQQTNTEAQPKTGLWLSQKLQSLYNDPIFQKADSQTQQHYRTKAYQRWITPYYKNQLKIEVPFTLEQFQRGQFINPTSSVQQEKNELRQKAAEKQQAAMIKATSKSLSGISNLLSFIFEPPGLQRSKLHKPVPGEVYEDHSLVKAFKYSEKYYDKQAQDMEDRIQDLGGHTVGTRMSGLVADAAMFEATGATKGASLLKLANPRTVAYTTRLLKAEWNGAITGLFWGASTGTKPQDLHEDMETFALFGVAGASGTQILKFLRTFSKVTPPQVVQETITNTITKLLTGDGVIKPKQEVFQQGNIETNKQAAEAGIAQTLNTVAAQLQHFQSDENINGAFRKLTSTQQKLVITRLFSALSHYQQQGMISLANEIGPIHLEEIEQNAQQVAPVVSQVQQNIDNFIKSQVPQGSKEDVIKMKLGATLPHHNTSLKSPLAHVSARISWLNMQLRKEGVSASDRVSFQDALQEEKELFKKIKDITKPRSKTISIEGSISHGTRGVSIEELQRPGKHYVVSKSGEVTYHGKQFDPGSTKQGSTHVTVLPNGGIKVNQGQLSEAQMKALNRTIEELDKD